jgi:hypothetical protein
MKIFGVVRPVAGRVADRFPPLAAAPEPTLKFSDRQLVWALMTVAAVLYSIAASMRMGASPMGDEPHYLVMSIALGKYNTFDLTQAYANNDYLAFYSIHLDPHVFPNADGVMVPLHNFGGPILWTVPFELWGRPGAAAVVVLASVLTVGAGYRLLRELGIVRSYAALVTAFFVIGSPLYMYASMQFIDPFGALFVTYAARVLVCLRPTRTQVALASAGLGWLPWVHGRFMLFTVIFGLLLILRVDRGGRTGRRAVLAYVPAALPVLALVIGLEAFNLINYGSLSPAPGNATLGDGVLQFPLQTGLAGVLFDRQYGLIGHFPVIGLAVPGMFLAARRRHGPRARDREGVQAGGGWSGMGPQAHWMLLAVILPYVLAISTFRAWFAGYSPPARLSVVLVPLLAYYVAVTLQRLHHWVPLALAALSALFGLAVTVTGDFVNRAARFSTIGGEGVDPVLNWLAERVRAPALPSLLPGIATTTHEPDDPFPWYMLLVAFAGVLWLWGRLAPANRLPDRPLLALVPVLGPLIPRARALFTRRPPAGAKPEPEPEPDPPEPADSTRPATKA